MIETLGSRKKVYKVCGHIRGLKPSAHYVLSNSETHLSAVNIMNLTKFYCLKPFMYSKIEGGLEQNLEGDHNL